ncbi:MAG: phenylalanine--tRNA ligase subunit beta [Verrucomicrobiales bacterium]
MIISLHWLADHIDLDGLKVDEIARLLTFAGVEVEDIRHQGITSDKIVVGEILAFQKHPDADKLSVCQVEAGQPAPLNIVCGAKNFQTGDKVPLALEGAVLPGAFKIKRTRMRGVESEGMLCSGKELGLSDDADGLLILPSEAPTGRPVGEFLGADTLIQIEVTPNRPDLLSHRGVAREIRAVSGRPLRNGSAGGIPGGIGGPPMSAATPRLSSPPIPPKSSRDVLICLEAAEACPFYSGRIIRHVKVAPSPDWLRLRLESINVRSINNVVDATNYILHDVGQPLHAFDLQKLSGKIVIRHARSDERFLALDGVTYPLTPDDLVIADEQKPVAIAGVMGGSETGVVETTTDILLEAAYFSPSRVRRTCRRLGLGSDSSYRFERGVDPQAVLTASAIATQLIEQLAGGQPEEEIHLAGEPPRLTGTVSLEPHQVSRLLGVSLPEEKITGILSSLGLRGTNGGWQIPSYRADLQRPVDLIEEIARVAGLDAIPARRPAELSSASQHDFCYDFRLHLERELVTLGFFEARTIKFISEKQLAQGWAPPPESGGDPLRLKNPVSDDHTMMRPSLLPGLLEVAAHNLRHGVQALRFFETGTVFAPPSDANTGAAEKHSLALLMSGPHEPASWLKKDPWPVDFFDLRRILGSIVAKPGLQLLRSTHAAFVMAAQIVHRNKVLGIAGQLTPITARAIDARHPVFAAEIDLTLLQSLYGSGTRFEEMARFPAVTRDVALEVPEAVSHRDIEAFFEKQQRTEPLLQSVRLFDVFSDPAGQRLPAGKKSLAFSLTYRDTAGTLEGARVDAIHQRLITGLVKSLPATVR